MEARVTDGANFKCFLHCLFMEYKWMDEDGGFLLHEIKITLEEAKVELPSLDYILFKCTALQSVDKCERSFEFLHCFWTKNNQVQTNVIYNVFSWFCALFQGQISSEKFFLDFCLFWDNDVKLVTGLNSADHLFCAQGFWKLFID